MVAGRERLADEFAADAAGGVEHGEFYGAGSPSALVQA